MNTISVIMPTYNRAGRITDAIESVLSQTYRELEIIIIDDGSTDSTEDVVRKYLNDSRIRYIRQENAGAAAARNRGIKEAKGAIIGFIDSDDVWVEDKLLVQMSVFRALPEVGVVCSDFSARLENSEEERSHIRKYFSVFDDYGLSYDSVFERKNVIFPCGTREVTAYWGRIYETMVFGNCILTSTALCRREVFDEVGVFDTTFETLEDYDLFLRIAKAFPAALVDAPLILYNYSDDRLSGERMFGKVCINLIEIYRKNLNAISDRSFFIRHRRRIRRHWGRIHAMMAYFHFSKDEMTQAAKSYCKSIVYDPANVTYYAYLAGSFLPKGIICFIRDLKARFRREKKESLQ